MKTKINQPAFINAFALSILFGVIIMFITRTTYGQTSAVTVNQPYQIHTNPWQHSTHPDAIKLPVLPYDATTRLHGNPTWTYVKVDLLDPKNASGFYLPLFTLSIMVDKPLALTNADTIDVYIFELSNNQLPLAVHLRLTTRELEKGTGSHNTENYSFMNFPVMNYLSPDKSYMVCLINQKLFNHYPAIAITKPCAKLNTAQQRFERNEIIKHFPYAFHYAPEKYQYYVAFSEMATGLIQREKDSQPFAFND